MNRYQTAAAVAMTVLAAPAFASETDGRGTVWSWFGDWDPSFYAGASVHQGSFDDWSAVAQIDTASFTARDRDDAAVGIRVSGGMQFLDNLALEATYADFGGASFAGVSNGSGAIWEPGTQREEIELSGFGLHLVGRLQVSDLFSASARVGAWSMRSERHQSGIFDDAGTPTPFDIRDTGTSTELGYGASIEYDGFAPLRIALEYDATAVPNDASFGDGDLRSVGVSLKYLFRADDGGSAAR
jgi:hypothetical protein